MRSGKPGTADSCYRGSGRFPSYLKKQLVHVKHNLYLNRGDPSYYEKVLRYVNPSCAEAHYRVGAKCEEEGSYSKALKHYLAAAMDLSSSYSFKAKLAMRRLLEEEPAESAARSRKADYVVAGRHVLSLRSPESPHSTKKSKATAAEGPRSPGISKPILAGFIMIHLLLLVLLLFLNG